MKPLDQILTAERVYIDNLGSSKKKVLQTLAERIAGQTSGLSEIELFDQLIARERLGSTGLGQGLAVPHCRLAAIKQPIAALAHLTSAVDYEAPDNEPVDLLFALVVPEDATDEHLNLLAAVVERFNNSERVSQLRAARDSQTLYQRFISSS